MVFEFTVDVRPDFGARTRLGGRPTVYSTYSLLRRRFALCYNAIQ